MSAEEIENAALKLSPTQRARLATRLLESLETLSDAENEKLWVEEAARRDATWEHSSSRPAEDVLQDIRSRLK